MFKSKKVTGNLFDSRNITAERFLNFCMFVEDAMQTDNKDGKYSSFLQQVQDIITSVGAEINDVDTGTSDQLNSTSAVNKYMYDFGQFMKNNSGAIAYALGGNTTDAYRQFYPTRRMDYIRAKRKTMPKLTARTANLATKYADSLGTQLTSDLQGFLPGYKKVLAAQRQQITNVKQNRIERNAAFTKGQWTLTGVVHDVASLNNGNPEQTDKLFPFAMLYSQSKNRGISFTGTLAVSENKDLLNRTLTPRVTVTVQNTCVNADVMVWLALSPKDVAPVTAVTVKANSTATLKASDLGDLKNPFLMITNSSSINEASYIVTLKGLKRKADAGNTPVTGNDDMKIA